MVAAMKRKSEPVADLNDIDRMMKHQYGASLVSQPSYDTLCYESRHQEIVVRIVGHKYRVFTFNEEIELS